MHEKQMAKVKKMGDEPKKKFQETLQTDEPQEEDKPKGSVVAEESSEELFEEVKSTEATLVAASDEVDEVEATRASVAEWLTNNVLRK